MKAAAIINIIGVPHTAFLAASLGSEGPGSGSGVMAEPTVPDIAASSMWTCRWSESLTCPMLALSASLDDPAVPVYRCSAVLFVVISRL